MIRDAYGWLRAMAMTSSVQPPAPPVRTPRIETPAPLRHTVPPTAFTTSSDLPPRESLADLQRYAWRCVGLCIGGTCERCDGLADQISEARLIHDLDRLQAREAELLQQINALREGRC